MVSVERTFATQLSLVSRKWRVRLDERLKHTVLTEARWLALYQISRSGRTLTQRELAEQLQIEGPTLVRTLDGLEAKGLIERQPVADDRRAKAVVLTAAACPIIKEIGRIANGLRCELLAGLDRDELEIATSVLMTIGEKLER